jgi:hypothetical protein
MTVSFRPQLLAIPAAFSILALSAAGAAAFECPKHFTEAQTLIDKVTGDMKGDMSKKMPKDQMALVHALLDDAKMLLAGAKHNHEKPQGPYDHGRSIAKAEAARGSALAADLLHFNMMQM